MPPRARRAQVDWDSVHNDPSAAPLDPFDPNEGARRQRRIKGWKRAAEAAAAAGLPPPELRLAEGDDGGSGPDDGVMPPDPDPHNERGGLPLPPPQRLTAPLQVQTSPSLVEVARTVLRGGHGCVPGCCFDNAHLVP